MNSQNKIALFVPLVSRVFSDYMGTQFFPSESLLVDDFDDGRVKKILKKSYNNGNLNNLYVHIPFCKSLCYYCHCFKFISNDKVLYSKYLDYLEKEAKLHFDLNGGKIKLDSIFIGGGTPNILPIPLFERLFQILDTYFEHSQIKQYNIDLNPYVFDIDQIKILKKYGVKRCTYAIQSLSKEVLDKNHRYNKETNHAKNIQLLQENGIEVNVDLMIGIDGQTYDLCSKDIEGVIKMKPDNISLNYFIQSENVSYKINDDKLELIDKIKKKYNKYVYSEFNKTENFQEGTYLRYKKVNLIGLGVGAISHLYAGVSYVSKDFDSYFNSLDEGKIAVSRLKYLDEKAEGIKYLWKNIVFGIDTEHFKGFFGVSPKEMFPREFRYLYQKGILKDRGKYIVSNVSDKATYINFGVFFTDILPAFYKKNEVKIHEEVEKLKKFFINGGEKLDEDYS